MVALIPHQLLQLVLLDLLRVFRALQKESHLKDLSGLGIPFEKDFHRIDGVNKFTVAGILQCEDRSHEKRLPCNLKFVRSLDNTEFKIEANLQLLTAHCDDHRDVKLYISGKYTVRTIFGNDCIEVKSFRKMKKLDENEVQAFLIMTKNSNSEMNSLYHASFNIGF